ncbi:MAG: phosphoglucosamine mutase [Kofleriaceae bacterium]|nr:phosphoglucosamine mutase [Kofleriaceae bacterium]MBP6836950.1 phosphoglucosamine mutase [Kofleriaceae bacterium]MBP9204584.1 phosphoglucosamine mutase [Kofleriaceae bacterium]
MSTSPTRALFGTDGVRGVANVEPMTGDTVMRLGMAVAARLRQPNRHTRIVIGKDTRLSGYMFETALASGIVAMGADVWLTGPLPTPGIAFITSSMRCDAGVVISASHNPYQDNGIKLFARDGFKLPDAVEAEIEALMASPDLDRQRAAAPDIGYSRKVEDARGRYIVFCKNTFPADLTLDGLTLVVDGANGAGYRVGPDVFAELGAKVIRLHDEPNGKNINDGCGALHPEAMCAAVRAHGAHAGIALDGDADRLVLCDEHGEVIDGDAVMALCATRLIGEGRLAKNTLVTTVMSNLGLERAVRAAGGKVIRTQVGDRYVVDEMRRGGYNLGGEQSGHLVFLDHATTGDGIVAALRVLAIMAREGRPLSELAAVMTKSPQVLVNTKVDRKVPLAELPTVSALIRQAEAALGEDGRILVRYSGTESKVRVMIEGPDQARIQVMADEIAAALAAACRS